MLQVTLHSTMVYIPKLISSNNPEALCT